MTCANGVSKTGDGVVSAHIRHGGKTRADKCWCHRGGSHPRRPHLWPCFGPLRTRCTTTSRGARGGVRRWLREEAFRMSLPSSPHSRCRARRESALSDLPIPQEDQCHRVAWLRLRAHETQPRRQSLGGRIRRRSRGCVEPGSKRSRAVVGSPSSTTATARLRRVVATWRWSSGPYPIL